MVDHSNTVRAVLQALRQVRHHAQLSGRKAFATDEADRWIRMLSGVPGLNWQAMLSKEKHEWAGVFDRRIAATITFLENFIDPSHRTEKVETPSASPDTAPTRSSDGSDDIARLWREFEPTIDPAEWERIRPHMIEEVRNLPDGTPIASILPTAYAAAKRKLDVAGTALVVLDAEYQDIPPHQNRSWFWRLLHLPLSFRQSRRHGKT